MQFLHSLSVYCSLFWLATWCQQQPNCNRHIVHCCVRCVPNSLSGTMISCGASLFFRFLYSRDPLNVSTSNLSYLTPVMPCQPASQRPATASSGNSPHRLFALRSFVVNDAHTGGFLCHAMTRTTVTVTRTWPVS